ncbi:MAG: rod shape-determining protein [Clostridia bacterium]
MRTIELSIDLGSKFITIFQKGIGLVLREPAIAACVRVRDRFEIREAGYRAESIITTALGGARIVAPINEGCVCDEYMCAMLLKHFLKKIIPDGIFKPHIKAMVMIGSSLSNSDRRLVEKCCLKAGIKEVTLVESPLALLAYTGSIGGLFVDIGGGKTEICAVTNHGIANGCSVNIAGDAFNGAIIDSIYMNYGVKLGEYTIENLKKSALSFYINDEGSYVVSGGGREGVPKSLCVTASDMRDAVIPLVDDIIEVIMSILNQTPPELSAEILRKGLFISGGSTLVPGLIEYIEQALELPVTPLKDIENAVAIGGAKFFENKNLLSDLLGIKLD